MILKCFALRTNFESNYCMKYCWLILCVITI